MDSSFTVRFPGQRHTQFFVPKALKEELQGTCFRPTLEQRAGEISLVQNVTALFRHKHIGPLILQELMEKRVSDDREQDVTITVFCDYDVGWDITDLQKFYAANALLECEIAPRAKALRVRTDFEDVRKAPRTRCLTVEMTVHDARAWKTRRTGPRIVTLRGIHPGISVGPLEGDMTAKTGRVWFGRNHPGE